MGYLDIARQVHNNQANSAVMPPVRGAATAAQGEKSERSEKRQDVDRDIGWRLDAFRAAIPARGPIWMPPIRVTPLTDRPGHCALCGDELPTDPDRATRFRQCAACTQALTLALARTKEA